MIVPVNTNAFIFHVLWYFTVITMFNVHYVHYVTFQLISRVKRPRFLIIWLYILNPILTKTLIVVSQSTCIGHLSE